MVQGERAVHETTNGNISNIWSINRGNDNSGGDNESQPLQVTRREGEVKPARLHYITGRDHPCFLIQIMSEQ